MSRRTTKGAIGVLFTISTFLFILTLSLTYYSTDIDYYNNNFIKNNISESTGLMAEELESISYDIINYLVHGEEYNEAMSQHFNEREMAHMVDVLHLFQISKFIKYASLIMIIILLILLLKYYGFEFLLKVLFYGNIINLAAFIALVFVISLDFNRAFIIFHHILFTNDLWILNPQTDLMINMLTEDFFMNLGLKIGLSYIIVTAVLIVFSFILLKWRRKDESFSN